MVSLRLQGFQRVRLWQDREAGQAAGILSDGENRDAEWVGPTQGWDRFSRRGRAAVALDVVHLRVVTRLLRRVFPRLDGQRVEEHVVAIDDPLDALADWL